MAGLLSWGRQKSQLAGRLVLWSPWLVSCGRQSELAGGLGRLGRLRASWLRLAVRLSSQSIVCVVRVGRDSGNEGFQSVSQTTSYFRDKLRRVTHSNHRQTWPPLRHNIIAVMLQSNDCQSRRNFRRPDCIGTRGLNDLDVWGRARLLLFWN